MDRVSNYLSLSSITEWACWKENRLLHDIYRAPFYIFFISNLEILVLSIDAQINYGPIDFNCYFCSCQLIKIVGFTIETPFESLHQTLWLERRERKGGRAGCGVLNFLRWSETREGFRFFKLCFGCFTVLPLFIFSKGDILKGLEGVLAPNGNSNWRLSPSEAFW